MPIRFHSTRCRFRLALPQDRRQIRLLLRRYHDTATDSPDWRYWQYLCFGLLLAIGLHWLLAVGGLWLLLYGVLGISTVAVACWLNLWLFEDWRNYWVIEQGNRLIACGKLTCYDTYSTLCDVVVAPEQRQRGIGSLLVASIAQKGTQPLYLACMPKRVGFYQRLGFVAINRQLLTAYLKRELGLAENSKLMVLRFVKHHQ